jgi:hypothetical protein
VRSRGYLLERADGSGQVAPDHIRPAVTGPDGTVRRITVG